MIGNFFNKNLFHGKWNKTDTYRNTIKGYCSPEDYRVAGFLSEKFLKQKILLLVVLLLATGTLLWQFAVGPLSIFLGTVSLAVALSCLKWQKPPPEEQSCALVSCCHYLGENNDTDGPKSS